jgi:hypothetical protein
MRGRTWAALITAAALAAAPAADARGVDIEALSSRPDQVSGGDALVRVEAPDGLLRKLRVARNGEDVTDALDRRDGALIGLVDGLELGRNRLVVSVKSRTSTGSASSTTRPRAQSSPGRIRCPSSARRVRGRAERLRAPDVGQRRRPVRAPGPERWKRHPAGVPRSERAGRELEGSAGRGPGGAAVPAGRRLRSLELAEHAPQPRRRRHTGAASRGRPGRDARCVHPRSVLRRRHRDPHDRLAALPRGRARHAQQPSVVRRAAAHARQGRRRVEPGHLVHGCASGSRVRPDTRGVRGDRRVDGEHPAASPARCVREQAGARDRPLLHHSGGGDCSRPARLGRDPRRWSRGALHGDVPAPFDLPHRRRRSAARWRVQVPPAVGQASREARDLRLLDAVGRRAGAARADLPDRGLRLHAGMRGGPSRRRPTPRRRPAQRPGAARGRPAG